MSQVQNTLLMFKISATGIVRDAPLMFNKSSSANLSTDICNIENAFISRFSVHALRLIAQANT